MSSVVTCLAMDLLNHKEVNDLASKEIEQVLILFNCLEDNGLYILKGEEGEQAAALVPCVPKIISFIRKEKVCFNEALVVHNHPHMPWHGEIIPSEEDITSTEILKWQLALLGIKLLDHVIICKNKCRTLKELQLYDNTFYKTKGLEIKRFLYCFLSQLLLSTHDSNGEKILDALEKNLDLLEGYYDKPLCKRLFKQPPKDNNFTSVLLDINTTDSLIKKLVQVLLDIKDNQITKINPDKIVPFGLVLQKKILCY